MPPSRTFVKRLPAGSAREVRWEATGLRWLAEAEADGGVSVVEVLDVTDDVLTLERLSTTDPPTPDAAERFGQALAHTHQAGAPAFGAGPPAWDGDGYLGPAHDLLPLPLTRHDSWGEFYGEGRLAHTIQLGERRGIDWDTSLFDRVIARLVAGEFDDDQPPARLHGDLWSGNVVWTQDGGVLIDPAAHGGHPLTDLAMLLLFGGEIEDRAVRAYASAVDLRADWRDLVGLHQMHPVMLHAVLFGGGYGAQAERLARRYG